MKSLFVIAIAFCFFIGFSNAQDEPSAVTYVTFAFDDSFRSGLDMLQYLENGWNATFYVSPARLGLHPAYLEWKDVHRLYKTGHEIGCHGFSHEKSFDLDRRSLVNQFCLCRAMLRRFGPPTSIAYPHGQVNDTIIDIGRHCKFCNGRGVGSELQFAPPDNVWNFKGYSIRREDTCSDLEIMLEDIILSNPVDKRDTPKWVVFNFHVMCEEKGDNCYNRYPFSITRSTYECLVNQISLYSRQGFVQVRNVRELLHLEPNQRALELEGSFSSVDLPSDFQFDPDDGTQSSAGTRLRSITEITFGSIALILVFLIVV